MTRIAAISAALAVVVFIGGTMGVLWFGGKDDMCRGGTVAGAIGGPFELVNTENEMVTDVDVITEPSLIYFGYTFCPDVCPLDAARNAEAVDLLAERGISATPIFITVDPARDTPEVLADFGYNLHEKMIGLTGSEEQIAAAARAYKTIYRAEPAEDDYYLVQHMTFTYLVMPEKGFVDFFRRELSAEEMADRVACFVKA